MKQFSNVIREYTLWMHSFRTVMKLLPYHLYFLFGGLGALFLFELFYQARKYYVSLYTIGHYGFFVGIFLTLAAPNKKYLPYAMWGYVLYILYSHKGMTLYYIIESMIYILFGYWFMKYEATQEHNGRSAM